MIRYPQLRQFYLTSTSLTRHVRRGAIVGATLLALSTTSASAQLLYDVGNGDGGGNIYSDVSAAAGNADITIDADVTVTGDTTAARIFTSNPAGSYAATILNNGTISVNDTDTTGAGANNYRFIRIEFANLTGQIINNGLMNMTLTDVDATGGKTLSIIQIDSGIGAAGSFTNNAGGEIVLDVTSNTGDGSTLNAAALRLPFAGASIDGTITNAGNITVNVTDTDGSGINGYAFFIDERIDNHGQVVNEASGQISLNLSGEDMINGSGIFSRGI